VRVVIADDALIVREGLARVLAAAGVEVVDQVADVEGLMRSVAQHGLDVAIVDVRMPPTFRDEGLVAANRLAVEQPTLGVLVLSQYAEPAYAAALLEQAPNRRGYLLKDRITHRDSLIGALYRIAAGETVVDLEVVDEAVSTPAADRRLAPLTPREREVLRCLASGLTDRGICQALFLSPKTVATHIAHIFSKLDLPDSANDNRRVHAVLAYLERG
jgi:DNA-binding NarL/FixJ family response regulator